VAVENPQTPRRQHEQTDAREKNPNDDDRQLARVAFETRRDHDEQPRREQDADEDQNGDRQSQQRSNDAGHAARELLLPFGQQARINRDERGRKDAFAKQVLQKIRDAIGGREDSRGVGIAEVIRENFLADESRQTDQQNSGGDQGRKPCLRTTWFVYHVVL